MTLPEIVFIPCGGHLGRRGWFRSATPGVGLSAIDSPDGIEIVALNVLPAWRGQGLGTAVVRAVKARAGRASDLAARWSTVKSSHHWTSAEAESQRKLMLAKCGFRSLTLVDAKKGFTAVLRPDKVPMLERFIEGHRNGTPELSEAFALHSNE